MLLWRPSKDRREEEANAQPDPNNRRKAGYNWGLLSVPKSRNSDLTEQELFFSGYNMKFRDWNPETDCHQTKTEMMRAEELAYINDIIKQATAYTPAAPPVPNADASDIPSF